MSSLTARVAKQEDLKLVRDCIEESYRPHQEIIGRPPYSLRQNFSQLISDEEVVLFDFQDKFVGMVVLSRKTNHLYLGSMAVLPRFQGRGYSREILSYAENEALSEGYPEIQLFTNVKLPHLHSLYRKFGYEETKRVEGLVYFRKNLGNRDLKIEAVIFDFDGVVADSNITSKTLCSWVKKLGLNCEYYQIIETIESLPHKVRVEKSEQLKALEEEALRNACLIPGFDDWVRLLAKRGIGSAIFSRNLREQIESFLENRGIFFDLIIGREDAAKKPDPDGIFIILDKLGSSKAGTLLIGDDPIVDISCGKKAGIRTALLKSNQCEIDPTCTPDFTWSTLTQGFE